MPKRGDFVEYLDGVTLTDTLNTAVAADRRVAIEGSAVAMEAAAGRVFFAFGDSTVDCTSVATSTGWIMSGSKEKPKFVNGSTHVSFWAESDTPKVYSGSVQ